MEPSIKRLKEILLTLPQIAEKSGEPAAHLVLSKELARLTKKRNQLSSEHEKRFMREFQGALLSMLHESTFGKYIYDKPRGYPGDYITQEMIWNAHHGHKKDRYLGTTPFGKLISSLTFEMENPKANIARVNFIKGKLLNSGKRIASIGCGSCIELWDISVKILKSKSIFLLDQDLFALIRAKKKLNHKLSENFIFRHENILKFIAVNKNKDLLGPRDLIYIIGLLDYFNVKSSKKIISSLWKNVTNGGSLLFTNAHPLNPTRIWMEYCSEWFLNYKDKKEVLEIVAELPNVSSVNYQIDKYNVYQYMEVIKNE